MNDHYKFSERWPANFLTDIRTRRTEMATSLSKIRDTNGDYYRGHVVMIRVFDAAIAAAILAIGTENKTS